MELSMMLSRADGVNWAQLQAVRRESIATERALAPIYTRTLVPTTTTTTTLVSSLSSDPRSLRQRVRVPISPVYFLRRLFPYRH